MTVDDVAPGSPSGIRGLASRIDATADEARDARQETQGIAHTTGSVAWEGETADGFIKSVERLPPLLALMGRSYDGVVAALRKYADELDDLRQRADSACEDCAAARRRQADAKRNLTGAEQRASSIAGQQQSAWFEEQQTRATALIDPGAASQLSAVASRRSQLDASARQAGQACDQLRQQVKDAGRDEQAAHRKLEQIKEERENAEKTCSAEISDSLAEKLENPGFFEKAGKLVGDTLDAVDEWVDEHADLLKKISGALKAVSAVAGVLSLIPGANVIFGPIALAAGGGALLIDATLCATGNGSWKSLAVDAALMALPGAGKLAKAALRPASGAIKASKAAKAISGSRAVNRLRPAVARSKAVQFAKRRVSRDPIDVATGEMVMSQTDVEVPGALPLIVGRTHVSSYREGRWFGPSWASTLDQRVEVDEDGVCYSAPDGVVLVYPTPEGSVVGVLPVEGPRWPLSRTPDGGYVISDLDKDQTLHFAPSALSGTLPVTAIATRNGHRIEVAYDPDGVITEFRHSAGYRIAVDTSEGLITALRLAGAGEDPSIVLMRYGYDADGRLTEVINSSNAVLRFTYDTAGRITHWEDRNGAWYGYGYDDDGRCVQTSGSGGCLDGSFTYDRAKRATVVTDSLGSQTTYHLNELDQVIREVDPLGNATVSEWDRYDRLLARTDPLGRTHRYRYDKDGNLVSVYRPDGSQTTAEYNDQRVPVRITEPDGATWRRQYDELGNLAALTDPTGATTRYTYDERGNLAALTDAIGQRREIETDGAGLPVSVTDPIGSVTRYARDGVGRVQTITDPVGGVTRLEWTVDGKLESRSLPDGATERWTYDGEGNVVEYVDAVGQVTRSEVTHFDLPAAETGPDGARLEFSYDTELRLVAVTNPQGLVWRYDYDPAGNLINETDFNGRVLSYIHDPAGQLVQSTNGAGQVTWFTRDILGNVTEQRCGDTLTAFEYDAGGRLRRATNGEADLTIERDQLGRVVGETCNGRTVTSTYDVLGRRIRRRTPSGADSVWEYDTNDQPVTLETAGHLVRFEYDAAGRETERQLAGATITQAWDANHRLQSQVLASVQADTVTPGSRRDVPFIQRRAYTYRPDGYVTGIEDHISGNRTFELDPAGRVTAVSGTGWSERYAYDPAGNVTQATWPTKQDSRSADAVGVREYAGTMIRSAGNVHYEHDAQGRVVLRQQKRLSAKPRTWRYAWNEDDRLVAVTTPEKEQWRYEYDPLGRRIAKQHLAADGATVVDRIDFTWDGAVLSEEVATSTGRVSTWEYEPGTFRPVSQTARIPLREASQQRVDEQFHAIVTDLIGTPTEMVNPDGTLAWHPRTSLWGAPVTHEGPADCPLRFPGQYFDSETGDNYNFFRYYDSAAQRYQANDPLGLSGGPNPNAYVSNPIVWTDPLGLLDCRKTPRAAGLVDDFGDHVVLGKSLGLEDRAAKIGGRHLMGSGDWQADALAAISNPNTRISVALDGLEGAGGASSRVMSAVQRASTGRGAPLDWELMQLYERGRLSTTSFYEGGRALTNPFG